MRTYPLNPVAATLRLTLAAALAAFLILSCSEDEAVRQLPDREELKETEQIADVTLSAVSGRSVVLLDDALLELVEEDFSAGRPETRSKALDDAFKDLGVTSVRRLFPDAGEFEPRTRKEGLHKWYVIEYDAATPATRAVASLGSVPGIEQVENEMPAVPCIFNDPYYTEQWNLSAKSSSIKSINVEPVWKHITTGSPDVIVAVIDGGIDLSHPDLAANCHTEHFNFVDNNTTIVPYDHGVHVAGIIGAVSNNGKGICGVAGGNAAEGKPGVRLMSCQVFKYATNTEGKKVTAQGSTALAIKWAADHGAVIAQNSWGYDFDKDGNGSLSGEEIANALEAKVSVLDRLAIDYFIKYAGCDNAGNQLPDSPMKGGVVFFSAGNNSIENGVPASYEPVVAVGATSKSGARATYSNYGDFVDISAPGTDIMSTIPNGAYGTKRGTSMSCPHVSGVAALVVSRYGGQGFTNEMLKEKVLGGANRNVIPSYYKIGAMVDAFGAMDYGSNLAPALAADLRVEVIANSLNVTWKVPANPEGLPAYGFKVFCSKDKALVEKAEIGAAPSDRLLAVTLEPQLGVGETVSHLFSDLEFGTDYYIKVISYSYSLFSVPSAPVLQTRTKTNNPPVISLQRDVLELKSFENAEIPVSISDPDRHRFTIVYSNASKADSFVSDQMGYRVVIDAAKAEPGTYSSSFLVTDAFGATATAALTYTILPNSPPSVVSVPEDRLVTSIGSTVIINLKECFTDADGERLRYDVKLSNPSMAMADVNGDELKLTVTSYGSVMVSVEAYDAKNASAGLSFGVLARAGGTTCLLYPNPVKDVLNIATGLELETAKVSIVSATGAKVFDGEMTISGFEPGSVNMSSCAPGKYSVTVKTGSFQNRQTIVKK